MDIVLVPGLWLDGQTWDDVAADLTSAGHIPHPITLPGMESKDADRSAVTIADCLASVTDAIDAANGPVVLVGHSAGAGVATAALDRRVDRVARIILIGGFPAVNAEPIMKGFPNHDGDIPLLDWAEFDDADLRDLDDAARAQFAARAIPSPAALALDPVALVDERRYEVPLTAVCTEFSAADLRGWIAAGESSVQDFARFRDVTYVDLPTGHWPQFTKPHELADVIVGQLTLAGRQGFDTHVATSAPVVAPADAVAPVDVVRAQMAAYRAQDAAAAERLLSDDFVFTSPQDDHIDKAAFMERCFPTADRFGRQETRQVVEIEPGLVMARYVADHDGEVFSNVELTTVREGRIAEVRVYFGGPDEF